MGSPVGCGVGTVVVGSGDGVGSDECVGAAVAEGTGVGTAVGRAMGLKLKLATAPAKDGVSSSSPGRESKPGAPTASSMKPSPSRSPRHATLAPNRSPLLHREYWAELLKKSTDESR